MQRPITAHDLTSHLEDLVGQRGAPADLRCDNCPECISAPTTDWAGARTGPSTLASGSPRRNGSVELLNSLLHDECLAINGFCSLVRARVVIADWKAERSTVRYRSARGYLTPADYARQCIHHMETDDSHTIRTSRRGRPIQYSNSLGKDPCWHDRFGG